MVASLRGPCPLLHTGRPSHISIDNVRAREHMMGEKGVRVVDWKQKLLSSDAARANPGRAMELIGMAEAALAGDHRAMIAGMEASLANDRSATTGPTRRSPAGVRAH